MKQILKQVLGVDVAQKELVVTLGKIHNDFTLDLYAYKVFKNNKIGFATLLKWLNPLINRDINLQFVMEATGVYSLLGLIPRGLPRNFRGKFENLRFSKVNNASGLAPRKFTIKNLLII
jgi:hypothetical protein